MEESFSGCASPFPSVLEVKGTAREGEDAMTRSGFVPDAKPGIGPEARDRLSLLEKFPRSRQRSPSSGSSDNKNKSTPTSAQQRTSLSDVELARHRGATSYQHVEKKVQHHMDIEDK